MTFIHSTRRQGIFLEAIASDSWSESAHPRDNQGKFSTSVSISSFNDANSLLEDLTKRQDEAAARLKNIPGVGSGQMGLTPQHVKETAEFQSAYRDYHQHTDNIHKLHRLISKHFPKELKAHQRAQQAARHEARMARAAASQ